MLAAVHTAFPRKKSHKPRKHQPQALQSGRGQQSGRPSLQITTHALWQPLENPLPHSELTISICCRITIFSRQPKLLKQLTLTYQPQNNDRALPSPVIETASIYQHKRHAPFTPHEEAYLTDGVWNNATQQLTFSFSKPPKIVAKKSFFVVISCQPQYEEQLKTGSLVFHNTTPLITQDLRKAATVS